MLVIFVAFSFFLPKISSDVSSLVGGGYNYPQPSPPFVQFEEPSPPSVSYLPPVPPVFQEEPPSPVGTYLPPVIYPPLGPPPDIFDDIDTVAVSPLPTPGSLYPNPAAKMKVFNMSCVLFNAFKSTIQIDGRSSFQPLPVLEDASPGCMNSLSPNTFVIDMNGHKKIGQCGVKRCSTGSSSRTNMCVIVRMPTIQGLKLPEDGLVTLQCTPHDSIASHTKHLRLGPT